MRRRRSLRRHRARQRSAGCIAGGALSLDCGRGRGTGGRDRATRGEFAWRAAGPRRGAGGRFVATLAREPAAPGMTDTCPSIARGWSLGPARVTQSLRRGAASVVRLWLAARAILFAGAARWHPAMPFPTPCARRSVLRIPGLQDITAWVDFTRLAEASRACGFELAGFTTQAHFLAGYGIDQEMHWLAGER